MSVSVQIWYIIIIHHCFRAIFVCKYDGNIFRTECVLDWAAVWCAMRKWINFTMGKQCLECCGIFTWSIFSIMFGSLTGFSGKFPGTNRSVQPRLNWHICCTCKHILPFDLFYFFFCLWNRRFNQQHNTRRSARCVKRVANVSDAYYYFYVESFTRISSRSHK